jgi:outer membrane PBP1 activator LpoA protein
MQTVVPDLKSLRVLLIAALYVSLFGCATPPAVTAPAEAAKPVTAAPAAAQPAPAVPAAAAPVVTAPLPPVSTEPAEPHIALILPLKSPTFAKAAEVVQQGFMAAASLQPNGLPVRAYPCNDEKSEVVAVYEQAVKEGAVAVAGPLTRNGVAALAANPDLAVPTLALNMVESVRADQLYFFGLPAEAESKLAAQWATKIGLLSAVIVRTDTALSKRLAVSFTENWQKAGGLIQSEIVYSGDAAPLRALPTDPGNMVFLAAETDKARLIRPYINNLLPIYAASQVFAGNARNLVNYDMGEIHFVDMPWVVQPDHPAVMIYPRALPPLSLELERLYALGIDAYRLLQVIYQHEMSNSLPLDGVTGRLTLNGHLLEREATKAIIRQGQGYPMDSKTLPPSIDAQTALENKEINKEIKKEMIKESKSKK